MDYSAPQSTQAAVFPPIKQLFADSWNNLISKLLPVLIFNSIALGITIAAIVLFIALLTGSVSLGNIISNPLATSIPILIILLVGLIVIIGLFTIFHIGNILVLSNNMPQISYKSFFRQSFSLILPVFFANFLVAFFIVGGMLLFVIPGIIFAALFQFVIYLIILDKLSLTQAIKKSIYIVSRSFGQVFVRLLILMLIPVVFSMILSFLTGYSLDEGVSSILNSIFSIFYSFFSIAYMITLLKQAKSYAGEGISNIRFIALISIGGWILALLVSIFGFGLITSLLNQQSITDLPNQVNSDFIPEEEDIFLEDDFLSSTPSAQPPAQVSPKPVVRVATPSAINP